MFSQNFVNETLEYYYCSVLRFTFSTIFSFVNSCLKVALHQGNNLQQVACDPVAYIILLSAGTVGGDDATKIPCCNL